MAIDGMKEVLGMLGNIRKRATRNRIARKAVTKAAQEVTKASKREMVHEDRTKALRKSQGYRVKTYQDTAVAIVGARGNYQTTWTSGSGRVYPVNPVYYDHLVEQGHAGPHPAKPFPHLKPAWLASKEQCKAIMEQVLSEEFYKEMAKLGRS